MPDSRFGRWFDPTHPIKVTELRRGLWGLFILKHVYNLSDEVLSDRWAETSYFERFKVSIRLGPQCVTKAMSR
jgi:hypothetical protein